MVHATNHFKILGTRTKAVYLAILLPCTEVGKGHESLSTQAEQTGAREWQTARPWNTSKCENRVWLRHQ